MNVYFTVSASPVISIQNNSWTLLIYFVNPYLNPDWFASPIVVYWGRWVTPWWNFTSARSFLASITLQLTPSTSMHLTHANDASWSKWIITRSNTGTYSSINSSSYFYMGGFGGNKWIYFLFHLFGFPSSFCLMSFNCLIICCLLWYFGLVGSASNVISKVTKPEFFCIFTQLIFFYLHPKQIKFCIQYMSHLGLFSN